MATTLLPCVEIEPRGEARASIVWLHGLGANGHDFEPIVPLLEFDDVRFVFPHAPSIPVTINGGFVMPAWYDITELALKRGHDTDGILRSAQQVRDLVARENERGVPCERIVLAGFSQGGAIATHLALRHDERLAGLVALSTYLVLDERVDAERSDVNHALPVFQGHGTHDPMVLLDRGEALHERLVELGHPVAWHTYPMQHAVCPQEIADLRDWLHERLDT
jgi:phospholipase/carboxylesterase